MEIEPSNGKLSPRNFDRRDDDRLVRTRELDFIADFRADQCPCERGGEGDSVRGRLALVMTDQVESMCLAVAHERDTRPEGYLPAVGKRCELGACQPLAPISGIAQDRLALLFGQLALQSRLKLRIPRPDLIEPSGRDQIRTSRDRQLEPRLEMFLIAFPAECYAHGRDSNTGMALILSRPLQKAQRMARKYLLTATMPDGYQKTIGPTATPFTHYWRIVAVLGNGKTEVFWGHTKSIAEANRKREAASDASRQRGWKAFSFEVVELVRTDA